MTVTSPNLVLPGKVRVPVPDSTVHLVPVAGPRGPTGPPGDAANSLSYVHTQSSPVAAGQPVQVVHGLIFRPAGIICLESDGGQIEYAAVTWPAAGILELIFGVAFAGTVTVS